MRWAYHGTNIKIVVLDKLTSFPKTLLHLWKSLRGVWEESIRCVDTQRVYSSIWHTASSDQWKVLVKVPVPVDGKLRLHLPLPQMWPAQE